MSLARLAARAGDGGVDFGHLDCGFRGGRCPVGRRRSSSSWISLRVEFRGCVPRVGKEQHWSEMGVNITSQVSMQTPMDICLVGKTIHLCRQYIVFSIAYSA